MVVIGISAASASAQTQDPRTLLQKVMSTYQSLNTYHGTASTESTLLYQGKVVRISGQMQVEMKFKRPNKLWLHFTNPSGTFSVTSDGAQFYVYFSNLNQYSQIPTAPDMAHMLMLLRFRAGVLAQLDPLYFLCLNQLPRELTNLKYQSSATYNNKPVFVVSGVTRAQTIPITDAHGHPVLDKAGHKLVAQNHAQYWTWWINRQTFLLEKIESRDPNLKVAQVKRQGKNLLRRTVIVTQQQRHIVLSATPNPPLTDKEFAFAPPAGAVPKLSVQDIIKNGK
jgi:outer membrane lipoprotein-sorting protein